MKARLAKCDLSFLLTAVNLPPVVDRGLNGKIMSTLGTLITFTTYGTWLRGDQRVRVDHGTMMPADPPLEAADRGRM